MVTETTIIRTIGSPMDPEFLAGGRSCDGISIRAWDEMCANVSVSSAVMS
jgi:hypothetical protein